MVHGSSSFSCSELGKFISGHKDMFYLKTSRSTSKDEGYCLAKWLLKHYFRWNEKHNQKQSFDWIQGLCWTPLTNSSLLLPTLAPWCQLHLTVSPCCEHSISFYFPTLFLLCCVFSPVSLPLPFQSSHFSFHDGEILTIFIANQKLYQTSKDSDNHRSAKH